MKIFREFELRGQKPQLVGVVEEIEQRLSDGWMRERDLENQFPFSTIGSIYCFSCTGTEEREAASLWLAYHNTETLYVSNIVPQKAGQLSFDQYNQILEEFYEQFAKPAAEALGLNHEFTSDTKQIEAWVSVGTAEKLKKFSRTANKMTGSSHPLDQQKWFDFLVAAHIEDTTLDTSTLARWLAESEDWPEEDAHELSIKYEFARSLLAAYDENRS